MAEQNKRGLFVRAGNAMRMFLFMSSVFMMMGIWLSGFENVHWFIYLIPGIFIASAVIGICPGLNMWRMLFKE